MAAKIKLQRVGTKNRPFYRVVVQNEDASPSSRVIEILGEYRTLDEPTKLEVDKDKTLDWIKKGAKPTEKVRILLGKAGILPPVDLSLLTKKRPKAEIKEEKAKAAVPAATPAAEEKPKEAPKEEAKQ